MEKLLFDIAELNKKQQADFFDKISSVFTEKELQALKIGVAYFRLVKNPELKNAMKNALAKQLYNDFNMEG